MKRYQHLLQLIDLFQPKTIVEVGTWSGDNAIRMIRQAQQHNESVTYYGFDLFEDATPETDTAELNVKPHHSVADVLAHIQSQCPGAEVILTKGNTNDTLKPMRADFAFIDGGHSIETIEHDAEMLSESAVIVHDDFYSPDENGGMPDIKKFGCNQLFYNGAATFPAAVESNGKIVLNVLTCRHARLPSRDPVKGGGYTQLVLTFGGA